MQINIARIFGGCSTRSCDTSGRHSLAVSLVSVHIGVLSKVALSVSAVFFFLFFDSISVHLKVRSVSFLSFFFSNPCPCALGWGLFDLFLSPCLPVGSSSASPVRPLSPPLPLHRGQQVRSDQEQGEVPAHGSRANQGTQPSHV